MFTNFSSYFSVISLVMLHNTFISLFFFIIYNIYIKHVYRLVPEVNNGVGSGSFEEKIVNGRDNKSHLRQVPQISLQLF